MEVRFILGEDKYVKLKIYSQKNEQFVIEDATYELTMGNEVVEEGSASIDGHYISVKLCPKKTGFHMLTITYNVADTVRKVKVKVDVVR